MFLKGVKQSLRLLRTTLDAKGSTDASSKLLNKIEEELDQEETTIT